MPRRFIDTSEGQLHCIEAGSGEPVVLLQTLPLGTVQLEPLLQELAVDHRCIAIDLMGYAPSDVRDRIWSVGDYADNLCEAFDALGLQRFRLLGGHLTGLVAAEITQRMPERVQQLVIDGAYAWTVEEQQSYRAAAGTGALDWNEDGTAIGRRWAFLVSLLRRFDPDFRITPENAAHIGRLGLAFLSLPVSPSSMQTTFEYDLLAALPRIGTATLLVRSPHDSLSRYHERALSLLPRGFEHRFESTNPLQQVSRPDRIGEYADMLRSFFRAAG